MEIRSRIEALRDSRNSFNSGDEPPPPPPSLNFPPTSSPSQFPRNVPRPPPLPPFNNLNFQGFYPPSLPQFHSSNVENGAKNVKQKLSGDRLISELERVIEKNEEEEEKIVPDNTFVDFIEKAPKILDYEYLIEQEKNKKNLMN